MEMRRYGESGVGKYGRDHERSNMSVKNTDSSFWKSMAKIWPKLEEKYLWFIGDGVSVDAWNDHWITQDIKIEKLCIHSLMQLRAAKVIDLVKENNEWNLDFLGHWLSGDILYRIVNMLPPLADA